jgi:tetratricopeptide (TPR) repeat protein
VNLLGRAQALLPEMDETRIRLLPDLGEALTASGSRDRASEVLVEAEQAATTLGDQGLLARANAMRVLLDVYRSAVTEDDALTAAKKDIAVLEAAADDAGLAYAWRLPILVYMNRARFDDASAAAGAAMQHAQSAGESRLVARSAQLRAYALLLGSVRVDEALAVLQEISQAVEGDRKAEAYVAGITSVLVAMGGDFERARELYAWERETLGSLGPSQMLSSTSLHSARVELLAGDPVAAEREARGDFDALGLIGETYFRSTVAGFLSRALLEQERDDDASAMAETARELSADDDVESQLLWRGVAARILARNGSADDALAMAESEREIAATISSPGYQADALTDTADVLVAIGRNDEAAPHLSEALRLLELKGDATSAARIRSRLEAIPA